ncbi:MAG: FkbM family methyltransferase [Bacteriovoracaceae bacterium]
MMKEIVKKVIPSPVWNYCRLIYHRRERQNFKPYTIKKNYCGFQLLTHISDGLAQGWYGADWKPLPELEFLKNYTLKQNAVVFDIGAHQGIVAQVMGKMVGSEGKIIAVEANKHNVQAFQKNINLNSLEHVKIVHAAIAAQNGFIEFSEALNGKVDDGSGEWGQVKTKATTIDTLIKDYALPDLIFIDVEGFEGEALIGAQENFSKIKSWFIEVHADYQLQSFGGSVEKILNYFPTEKYDLFVANDNHRDFIPFNHSLTEEIIKKRFFLIALRKT